MKKIILLVIVFFNIFPYISNKTVSMVGVQSAMAEIGSEKGEKKPILADTSTKKSTTDTSTNKNDTSKVHVYQTVTVVSGGTGGSSGGGGVTTSGGTVGGTLTGSTTSGTGSTDLGSSTQKPAQSTNTSTPCDDAKKASELYKFDKDNPSSNSIPSQQISDVRKKTGNYEYGSELTLSSPTSTSPYEYESARTNFDPIHFTHQFFWDNNNGYTIGGIHGHPTTEAPSTPDIVNPYGNLSNSDLVAGGQTAIDFYKNNYTSIVTTADATYIIKVNDWVALGKLHDAYYDDEALGKDKYLAEAENYKANNSNATDADASLYAALTLNGNAVTILKGDKNGSNFKPVEVDTKNKKISTKDCP